MKTLSSKEYIDGILKHDRLVLSRAITLVESTHPDHQIIANEIIEACLPYSGNSIRIGITGVPGVGKSTFIEAMGLYVVEQNHQLAVLAIDPSSEQSRGSILGDKTRMQHLSNHPQAYIRPSPTTGSLGGVARKTRESIILCEACGFDVIFVETVGVGQSETIVHSMVDFFLLLMLSGAGDELQGIKRGIMEMADSIAITKADGSNIEKAKMAASQYKMALHLFPENISKWYPKVLTCSSYDKTGLDQIWETIKEYEKHTKENGFFNQKRENQLAYWFDETLKDSFLNLLYKNPQISNEIKEIKKSVIQSKISPFKGALNLIQKHFKS
jgi:LAO/AO transport system kinase